MNNLLDQITSELEEIKDENLYRALKSIQPTDSVHGFLEKKPVTLFCSNDYLALSFDKELRKAAARFIENNGLGSGAARLISGTRPLHLEFERRLAQFLGKEKALLYSSGYLANLGVLSALLGENDLIVMDKLSHASLIDAARLSGARLRVYPHGNLERLDEILTTEQNAPKKAIVTDSVFSMDGDKAPLKQLIGIKKKHGAFLVLDEAHGFGVFGAGGRGAAEAERILVEVDIYIGTLSKAMGLVGGFVAGESKLIDFLINRSRTFIYDTALPEVIPAIGLLALEKIKEGTLRRKLWANIEKVRIILSDLGFTLSDEKSPIIPVILGEEVKALETSQALLDQGLLIPAVRYPTVAKGKARLRITVSAVHSDEDIKKLKAALERLK